MTQLKEAAAGRIITTYCRKLQGRAYADDFNKKLKAGITAKVEYHAFEVCNALLYKQVYAAFKKKFPEITDIAFGVTRSSITLSRTQSASSLKKSRRIARSRRKAVAPNRPTRMDILATY